MSEAPEPKKNPAKIVIMQNGSYHVFGEVPLVHKTQVVSEYGEPLTWQKDHDFAAKNMEGQDFYGLCRCGESGRKPFCDGTHRKIGFDGTETADLSLTAHRARRIPGGEHIIVKKDAALCMESGFCGFADAGIFELVNRTNDPKIRALVMAMVERCPSGALTYQIDEYGPEIEPDLPVQIAATTEITAEGPIAGPLWVTGKIPVERADGQPFETRNRVTLCNCGHSCQKPLCDGTHRSRGEAALRRKRLGEA
jgi:CDGSH-type Zn-finger protein